MSKRHPIPEQLASAVQRIAHVTKQEKFGWRGAVGMRGDPPLADVDFSIREKLAQMIIGPAVAEPELQHPSLQSLDKTSRKIEAGALRL